MKMLWHDILFGIFKRRSCKTKKKQPKKGSKIKSKISIRHICKVGQNSNKKKQDQIKNKQRFSSFLLHYLVTYS